ncbi:DUF6371 domain-containing protein [Hymenobacter negativus]|uniref:Toprim domain-containing protein n=1 Tax=Hymenobacter negativus TaxID=2795026 RepID=A0ABS0Q5Q9_9BACT|nr:DUF6371 domain-containing protein [Hymenobacter negativus]MBH8557920.1 hypothetical protein [Hymenobacter negativus]
MAPPYRFALQPYRYRGTHTRHDCPACGNQHRNTFARFVDKATGELLPAHFGRCNREDRCGYFASPYHKPPGGTSYAEDIRNQCLPFLKGRVRQTPQMAPTAPPVVSVPEEVVQRSFAGYSRNQFARLLTVHFGAGVAKDLLRKFEIGTSAHWPGACVFWLRDERGRVRGGQVVLFDADGHTVKTVRPDGTIKRYTSWFHTALGQAIDRRKETHPDWLIAYDLHGAKSPCLFGLTQALQAPHTRIVAVVEAPKTAVLGAGFFPQYTWVAVNALSYLNAERIAPLKSRYILLFPDASLEGRAFQRWQDKAQELQKAGFRIDVSDYLEQHTTEEQQATGYDLGDLLLAEWPGYPPNWDVPHNESPGECSILNDFAVGIGYPVAAH